MKKIRAFTLVELIIAMVISGLVMASVLVLFFSVFKSYEVHQDITEAKQRGQIALASIQPFVMNTGLGLPSTKSSFQTGFSGLTSLASFESFIQLASDDISISTGTEAPALWLVYSVPSSAGVNDTEYLIEAKKHTLIFVERFADLAASTNLSTNKLELKSWVSFPGAISPFWVSAIDQASSSLTLYSETFQTIKMFDEMHFTRAVKLYVRNDSLYANRLDGSGEQPIADGIAGMWCTFDTAGDRVLTVRVLARASTRRGDTQSTIEGWPSEAPPPTDPEYRYAAVSRSWRIRN
jgi:prepilin-type N-terminal cleavage/methylation domain-containing protein